MFILERVFDTGLLDLEGIVRFRFLIRFYRVGVSLFYFAEGKGDFVFGLRS